MYLIGTHILDPEEVRRATKMAAEVDDRIDVGSLRRRREIADPGLRRGRLLTSSIMR